MKIGLEVEFYLLGWYGEGRADGWAIGYDNSIRAPRGFMAVEARRLCSDLTAVRGAVQDLVGAAESPGVNTSCGGHIHYDFRDLVMEATGEDPASWSAEFRRKFIEYFYQSIQYGLVSVLAVCSPSRWENDRYCRVQKTARQGEGFTEDEERYEAVNVTKSLAKHGTIEIRCFPGSVDPEKWQARAVWGALFLGHCARVALRALRRGHIMNWHLNPAYIPRQKANKGPLARYVERLAYLTGVVKGNDVKEPLWEAFGLSKELTRWAYRRCLRIARENEQKGGKYLWRLFRRLWARDDNFKALAQYYSYQQAVEEAPADVLASAMRYYAIDWCGREGQYV
jgi:hypothetical protein